MRFSWWRDLSLWIYEQCEVCQVAISALPRTPVFLLYRNGLLLTSRCTTRDRNCVERRWGCLLSCGLINGTIDDSLKSGFNDNQYITVRCFLCHLLGTLLSCIALVVHILVELLALTYSITKGTTKHGCLLRWGCGIKQEKLWRFHLEQYRPEKECSRLNKLVLSSVCMWMVEATYRLWNV